MMVLKVWIYLPARRGTGDKSDDGTASVSQASIDPVSATQLLEAISESSNVDDGAVNVVHAGETVGGVHGSGSEAPTTLLVSDVSTTVAVSRGSSLEDDPAPEDPDDAPLVPLGEGPGVVTFDDAFDAGAAARKADARRVDPAKREVTRAGEVLAADVFGPDPTGINGEKYGVVVKDRFTGGILVFALRNKDSVSVMSCILSAHHLMVGGTPDKPPVPAEVLPWVLHTDQGGEFIGDAAKSMLARHGGIAYHSTPYRHAGEAGERGFCGSEWDSEDPRSSSHEREVVAVCCVELILQHVCGQHALVEAISVPAGDHRTGNDVPVNSAHSHVGCLEGPTAKTTVCFFVSRFGDSRDRQSVLS